MPSDINASVQCVLCLEACAPHRASTDDVLSLLQNSAGCEQHDPGWGRYSVCAQPTCAAQHALCNVCVRRFLLDAALGACPMCRGKLAPVADLCQRYTIERSRCEFLEREVRELRDLSKQHAQRLFKLYCRDMATAVGVIADMLRYRIDQGKQHAVVNLDRDEWFTVCRRNFDVHVTHIVPSAEQVMEAVTDEYDTSSSFGSACNDLVEDVHYASRVPSTHEMLMILHRDAAATDGS